MKVLTISSANLVSSRSVNLPLKQSIRLSFLISLSYNKVEKVLLEKCTEIKCKT